jgi:thiol-disulfide isomerase/thioredoxin
MVGIAVGVAIVVLVAYALLRPAPTSVRNGAAAPDFTFTDPQGASHSLSSFFGKPVVLWWVATFCGSCDQGTQIFAQQYYSQYHSAGVTFLEIESYNDLGQSGPSIGTMAGQNGYTGQAGWIIGEGSSQGTSAYNPNSDLDIYYVISAQGNVVTQGTPLTGSFGAALSAAQGSG